MKKNNSFLMSKNKINLSTFLEGLTVGIINTFILFELNRKSLLIASLWSATFILGTVLSLYIKIDNQKVIKNLSMVARTLLIPVIIFDIGVLSIIGVFFLGVTQAVFSRKQFIRLKEHISEINVNHLTAHGSINALGYGIGSVLAGLANDNKLIFIVISITAIFSTFKIFPTKSISITKSNLGLTKRDLYIASIFTFSTTPLNNTLGLLIYTNIFNEEIASLGALLFNLGSILAPKLKYYITRSGKPIAYSLLLSSIIFISTLYIEILPYFLISRLVIGSILFSAQGLLEERSKTSSGNPEKGLEHLWQIFSFFSFLSLIILPFFGERFGYLLLGIISIISSFVIMLFKKIIK
jgi:hypothetical protein